jgi:parallel beta-helix repeat protein
LRVRISSLILTLLILGSAVLVSLPFLSAKDSQSIISGTIILDIIDVNANESATHAGAVIEVVTKVNVSWDVIDFSAFHVETYYDSQLIGYHVLYVMGIGQEIINVTSIWNTTGVEPGSYTISAIAYGSNLANFIDGFVQILPPPKTWIVDDDGPADFNMIQDAINAASDGDTIFVKAGTYYELIVVNKIVSLVGENASSTIIDGNCTGTVMTLVVDDVTVSGFTIRNGFTIEGSGEGVFLDDVSGCKITQNNVTGNGDGIFGYGDYNVIADNCLAGNQLRGVDLGWFGHELVGNNITGNVIDDNSYFGIQMVYGTKNIVMRNNISEQKVGLQLYGASSQQNIVCNNIFHSNGQDLHLYGLPNPNVNGPCNNTIVENTLETILIEPGENNRIFHNNFLAANPVIVCDGNNTWDEGYPSGGNYWSDYNGTDLFCGSAQNETGSDGIGDTQYLIDANNTDRYPLMSPWTPPDSAALNITSSKTIVGQGFSINVTVSVENQGSKIEELNVTFYANESLIDYKTFMLTSNNSITYSSNWNLSSLAKGNYSLSVRIEPLESENDLNDNSLSGNWLFISIPGDINGDKTVDIYDAILLAGCFNYQPYYPHWDPNRDVNGNGIVDIFDAVILALHYGESWT